MSVQAHLSNGGHLLLRIHLRTAKSQVRLEPRVVARLFNASWNNAGTGTRLKARGGRCRDDQRAQLTDHWASPDCGGGVVVGR